MLAAVLEKLADFVLLEKNIFEIQPSEIRNVKVSGTSVGGKLVYPAN